MSKIETWHLLSDRRDLERWARIRVQGQAHYLINGALMSGLFMMLINDLIDGGFGFRIVLSAHLTGAAVAWFTWRDMESKYQRALLKARQKATAAPTNILGLRDS